MENVFIELLPPWAETGTQPAFYDLESGSVLQQTARMYAKVNELTESQNELYDKFVEVYNYVHDYFDNLDVQEEINNKLDELVEDGTLQSLLEDYKTTKFYFAPTNNNSNNSSGDCSVIKTITGKVILIDTGISDNYTNIKNYLDSLEVTKIDYLIISHYHADHVGNLASLMSDYDMTETVCYLPRVPSSTVYATPYTLSQTVLTLLTDNTIIYPTNNQTETVDNLKLTFVNCSEADLNYYTTNNIDYNNCSMCVYVKDREVEFFYTGDIMQQAQARMYASGLLHNVQGYKCEHHGVNTIVDSNYLRIFKPEKVIVTNNAYNSVESEYYGNAGVLFEKTLSYFSNLGATLYLSSFSSGNEFISNGMKLNAAANNIPFTAHQADINMDNGRNAIDVYVDVSYTGISDGTINRPFKMISDAIRFATPCNNTIRINIADGTYDEKVYVSNMYQKLIMTGNSSDATAVKIKQMIIVNSYGVNLQYVNFNQAINNVLTLINSKCLVSNVVIDGDMTPATTALLDGRGINIQSSDLKMSSCTISNKTIAIFANENSNVGVDTLSGTNNNYLYAPYFNSIIKSSYTSATYNTKGFIRNVGGYYIGDMLEKGQGLFTLSADQTTDSQSLALVNFDTRSSNTNTIANVSSGTITIAKNVNSVTLSGCLDIKSGVQSGDTCAVEIKVNDSTVYALPVITSGTRTRVDIPARNIIVDKNDTIKVYFTDYSRTGAVINHDTRYTFIQLVTNDTN